MPNAWSESAVDKRLSIKDALVETAATKQIKGWDV